MQEQNTGYLGYRTAITADGDWFTGGAATVTERVVEPVAPLSSVTVNVTVNVPSAAYVWLGATPVPVVPSPKFQRNDAPLSE